MVHLYCYAIHSHTLKQYSLGNCLSVWPSQIIIIVLMNERPFQLDLLNSVYFVYVFSAYQYFSYSIWAEYIIISCSRIFNCYIALFGWSSLNILKVEGLFFIFRSLWLFKTLRKILHVRIQMFGQPTYLLYYDVICNFNTLFSNTIFIVVFLMSGSSWNILPRAKTLFPLLWN